MTMPPKEYINTNTVTLANRLEAWQRMEEGDTKKQFWDSRVNHVVNSWFNEGCPDKEYLINNGLGYILEGSTTSGPNVYPPKDEKPFDTAKEKILEQGTAVYENEYSANSHQIGGTHYQVGIQPWDFIIANQIGFLAGNVIKYVARYKNKDGLQDLKKARHYLEKLIEVEEKNDSTHGS